MRKPFIILFVIALALILASPAAANIAGSKHDFSGQSWANAGQFGSGTVCGTCHTPHHGTSAFALWNREIIENSGYADNLITAYNTEWGIPDGPSLLCLSCHDGTVALDNFGGMTDGSVYIDEYPDGKQIGDGVTLSGEHPISVLYDETVGDGDEFFPVASVLGTNLRLYGLSGSEKIECGSCHDVHNKNVELSTMLLRMPKNTICQACHNK
jgi:predicted CXXCH cytochrome family protein